MVIQIYIYIYMYNYVYIYICVYITNHHLLQFVQMYTGGAMIEMIHSFGTNMHAFVTT